MTLRRLAVILTYHRNQAALVVASCRETAP